MAWLPPPHLGVGSTMHEGSLRGQAKLSRWRAMGTGPPRHLPRTLLPRLLIVLQPQGWAGLSL